MLLDLYRLGTGTNEPAGTRTQDHLLKREMLYRLSYRLNALAGTPIIAYRP